MEQINSQTPSRELRAYKNAPAVFVLQSLYVHFVATRVRLSSFVLKFVDKNFYWLIQYTTAPQIDYRKTDNVQKAARLSRLRCYDRDENSWTYLRREAATRANERS